MIIGFSQILRCRPKGTVSLVFFGEKLSFSPFIHQKCVDCTSSLNTLYTAESVHFYSEFCNRNAKFHTAFSPTAHIKIRKCPVKKKTLCFTLHFQVSERILKFFLKMLNIYVLCCCLTVQYRTVHTD